MEKGKKSKYLPMQSLGTWEKQLEHGKTQQHLSLNPMMRLNSNPNEPPSWIQHKITTRNYMTLQHNKFQRHRGKQNYNMLLLSLMGLLQLSPTNAGSRPEI